MATSREYMEFIIGQLDGLQDIACRAMMGEYVLYYRGKVFGGIYDDRLLVKPVAGAAALLPEDAYVQPYPGAKPMLLVENVDDKQFLAELLQAMYDELPLPKRRK